MIEDYINARNQQIRNNIVDSFEKGGKPAQLGERRQFAGKWYRKIVGGWRLIASMSTDHPNHPQFVGHNQPASDQKKDVESSKLNGPSSQDLEADSAVTALMASNPKKKTAFAYYKEGILAKCKELKLPVPTFELTKTVWGGSVRKSSTGSNHPIIDVDPGGNATKNNQRILDKFITETVEQVTLFQMSREAREKGKGIERVTRIEHIDEKLLDDLQAEGVTVHVARGVDSVDRKLTEKALRHVLELKKQYRPGEKGLRNFSVYIIKDAGDGSSTVMQAGNNIVGDHLYLYAKSDEGKVLRLAGTEAEFDKTADTRFVSGFHPAKQQSHIQDYITHEFAHVMQVSEMGPTGKSDPQFQRERSAHLRSAISEENKKNAVSEYAKTIQAEHEAEAFVLYHNGDRSAKTMASLKTFRANNKLQ